MEINIKEVLRDYKERELNEELIEALKDAARKCRLWALTMTTAAKSGHIGGSLSKKHRQRPCGDKPWAHISRSICSFGILWFY
jgi:hypothetical protein